MRDYDTAKCAIQKPDVDFNFFVDFSYGFTREIGQLVQSSRKIETALPAKNSNRLTDLFLSNKAVKTVLWFSGRKNVVCLRLNVVCLF